MDERIKKYSSEFIIGGFTIVILLNIASIVYGHIKSSEDLSTHYLTIFVTLIFLGGYLISKKIYENKLSFIPDSYYYIAMIFAYLALFLGSYLNFYEKITWWDTMLHFASGILLGLLSIIIVSYIISHRFATYKSKRDIIILICIGVLLSMSIAVFWEFYEYTYDYIVDGNMQRSVIVEDSSTFDASPYLRPSGRFVDPGLQDTIKDQFLATIGAFVAGIYSYYHFNAIQLQLKK